MRLTLALVATMALAVLAPPAHALTETGKLARYEPVARAAWPGSACTDHEQVTLNADGLLLADSPGLNVGVGMRAVGEAFMDGTCRVYIAAGLPAYKFCLVLVHEFGHLAGHEHEASGPMTATLEDETYWPCWAMTHPRKR
jgi:hypothetical protein